MELVALASLIDAYVVLSEFKKVRLLEAIITSNENVYQAANVGLSAALLVISHAALWALLQRRSALA